MLQKRAGASRWVILEIDSALDLEKSDYTAYMKSLFDEKHLVFVENEKPTRFKIRQLTSNQQTALADNYNKRKIMLDAIRFALLDIDNYSKIDDEGNETFVEYIEKHKEDKLGVVTKMSWMNEQNFDQIVIVKLYDLVNFFSNAAPFLSTL